MFNISLKKNPLACLGWEQHWFSYRLKRCPIQKASVVPSYKIKSESIIAIFFSGNIAICRLYFKQHFSHGVNLIGGKFKKLTF